MPSCRSSASTERISSRSSSASAASRRPAGRRPTRSARSSSSAVWSAVGSSGVKSGSSVEVPALPALGHPQRPSLPRARPALRLHRGAARHRDVAQLARVEVADLHRERPHAHAVLLGGRRDDVRGEGLPHPLRAGLVTGHLGHLPLVLRRPRGAGRPARTARRARRLRSRRRRGGPGRGTRRTAPPP